MVKIFFIYADKCKHCQEALSCIEDAIVECKDVSCEITKFKYNTKVAIAIARAQGIDDLPGFVIGSEVFVGEDYDKGRIVKAIKKAN